MSKSGSSSGGAGVWLLQETHDDVPVNAFGSVCNLKRRRVLVEICLDDATCAMERCLDAMVSYLTSCTDG